MSTLFERLGGSDGIAAIVDTVASSHLNNATIAKRFEPLLQDPARLKMALKHLCDFLAQGSGGPANYSGRSMPDAHRGMNISGEEYMAAVDDIMGALKTHGRDEQTQKDVLYIAYSLKPQIVRL